MSAIASIPQVVSPATLPASPTVSQCDLATILELRREIESVQAQLQMGEPVEPCVFPAYLKSIERRSVAWKQVCERELGEAYCKRVLAATKPDTFTHLVVEA